MWKSYSFIAKWQWSDVLFILSVDAVFLWSCVGSLGDDGFRLVDPYFLIQLQFRLIGTFVLGWAIASILASFLRSFVESGRRFFLKNRLRRRFYRLLVVRLYLEVIICSILVTLTLTSDPLFLLFPFSGIALGEMGFKIFGNYSPTDIRVKRKQEVAADRLTGLRGSIAILERRNQSLIFMIRQLIKGLILFMAIVLGGLHAEKLKASKEMTFVVADEEIFGSIVGQTVYGFLVWQDDCECLLVVGHGQLSLIRENK